jgi:hypothetical protein
LRAPTSSDFSNEISPTVQNFSDSSGKPIEEAELGEWEDDPPEVVSFEMLEEP